MRGQLTNGGCVISTDSEDLHINMGQYTTHVFERVGDLSAPAIPFTINLSDCESGIKGGVGITFTGITDPKEPDVFLVAGSDVRPTGISGRGGYSGLGLLITDQTEHQIIPGAAQDVFSHSKSRDMALHYVARYRVTSRSIWPGELRSEVRFDIAYP